MKFSEAIREGAKRWPNGDSYQVKNIDTLNGGCVLCVAMGAAGHETWDYHGDANITRALASVFPIASREVPCPLNHGCYFDKGYSFALVAEHLHLNERWSREAIAEWVETIEKKLEATGDKGAEVTGDENHATPPPCSQEIKDCTPVESTLSV